ncbi:MAG: phosphoribosylglycinamide formyltransferase [Acidimicrobiia bacterium]
MRTAVLVSGSGSNLQSLLDRSASDPGFGAEIVLVLSDRPGVRGLERASAAGVPTAVVAWADHADRAAFTTAVCDAIDAAGAELVVLAGFMRILAPEAVRRFPGRILNIHPSLLPAFPGAHAVEDALAHGVKLAGVTVHVVDEEVDHGPIIAQRAVEVRPDDDRDSLHARIQAVEHELYPDVVADVAAGRVVVDGRHVTRKDLA